MNKRDFLIQGGGTLLGGSSLNTAWGASRAAVTEPKQALTDASHAHGTPRRLAHWQALQGLSFGVLTPLGRQTALVLRQVSPVQHGAHHAALEQFTLAFEGPRGLPLPAGLHALTHPELGTVSVYLEPVQRDQLLTYQAHFSLLV